MPAGATRKKERKKSKNKVSHPIVIQKYGGSSVATLAKLEAIAQRVVAKHEAGYGVVVVVSAMGNTTDSLLRLASEITDAPPARELDMLLSTGERTTMALLSIAIQKYGAESISFTGSQSGIITTDSHANARIISVRPYRIQDELERGKIVIVAGFQGTSYKNEITTLGRGGSDMTAVALAGALDAVACEIYSDVDGVYTADPKIVLDAKKLDELSSSEVLELAQHGAKVLHDEAVIYAQRHQIALYAKKSLSEDRGTYIRPDGWPNFALERSKIAPIAVVSAKKTLFVRSVGRGVPDWLTSVEGVKVLHASYGKAHLSGADMEVCALLDVWNCNCLPKLEERIAVWRAGGDGSVVADAGGGAERSISDCAAGAVLRPGSVVRGDVRNATLVGLDIGRMPLWIGRGMEALAEAGVEPIHVFTEANALTFVVADDEVEVSSRALHKLVGDRILP